MRNVAPGSRTARRQRPRDKNCKFSKSKMADGCHFENRQVAILVKILSDFDKIWCTTPDIEPDEILKSTIAVS